MNKKIRFGFVFVLILIIILISINQVNAIGVSPGRKTLDFEPGLKTSVDYTIYNDEAKDMKVLVYVESELNDSIALHDSIIDFKASETSKTLKYDINLPQELKEPGSREARIVIREIPVAAGYQGTYVGASTAVVTQLYVNVPYPGKYAKISLTTSKDKDIITFFTAVHNLGTQDIVKAKAIIDIYGANNEKIITLETDSKSIKSKQRDELIASWNTKDINSGKYYARVTVTYDGETSSTESVFSIGELDLEILDVNVKDFKLGGIAKFNILIENKWSEDLKDVFAEMIILDQKGDEIIRFKSASETLKANSKEELIAYWDTEGIKEGIYNARLIIYYQDKTSEKQLRTVVTLNSIKAEFVGATAESVALKSGTNQGLMMFIVVILIGINIAWFVYFKKRTKKIK